MAVDPLASFARAQRAHEHLNLYEAAHGKEGLNRWIAVSLMDGACDLRAYSTKAEAARYQPRERECAYIFLNGYPTLGELRLLLDVNEELYDQGYELADPDTYVNPEAIL